MNERQVRQACTDLENYWTNRNKKFESIYDILLMTDTLEEEGMESFVGNDPRTFYNMALHMLMSRIPHKIPIEDLKPEEIEDATEVEGFLEFAWRDNDALYRSRGLQSWLWYFVSLLLATGWYSVFRIADNNRCIAEIWNPAEVFPEFGEDGLSQVVRTYSLTAAQARLKVAKMGWTYPGPITGGLDLRNYWRYEGTTPVNSILLGETFVKPETEEPFDEIPILVGPVAGLPDKGSIIKKTDKGRKWQDHFGESILATNEHMYLQYNKQRTFSNQLLRDTAQARWFERSQSGEILTEEKMFKRGAIFKGQPGDEVFPLPVPAIPVEIRTDRFDDQAMIQRGSLSWALHGNIQQQMSGYLMSQIAESTQQILAMQHQTIIDVIDDCDNGWLAMIDKFGLKPYQKKLPSKSSKFVVDNTYKISIPGDVVQRATTARMLDPDFELASEFVTDMLFPEIKNPLQNQAKVRKDKAMNHPISIMINLIQSFRERARELKAMNVTGDMAELYLKAAAVLEAQIGVQEQPAGPAAGAPAGAIGEAGGPGTPTMEGAGMPAGLPASPPGVV